MTDDDRADIRKLHQDINDLREDIDQLRRILYIMAATLALGEGDQAITHRYLRRLIAQVGGTSRDRLEKEALLSREFTAPAEQALDLMADRAREMNLSEFADWLQE